MNYEVICKEICQLAKEAGTLLKREIGNINNSDIEVKGLHNFVTYVDRDSEKLIVTRLSELLPEAGFIVEEKTATKSSEKFNWVVDPLDGTTNYIHGLPCYSISIALMNGNNVVIGVVYEVNHDECFYAWENSQAFLNGKEIMVSKNKTIADAMLATGFPYYDYSKLGNYLNLFRYFLKNSHGMRRLGSAAVDLAYVACGRFDGFFEYGLNPWDVAAGSFILLQAGGKVSDFRGGADYIFCGEILASNSAIANELQRVINKEYLNFS